MKTWFKQIPIWLGIWSWVLATALGQPTSRPEAAAAIQAIQQASDPSAVVTAYANGVAADRNDPRLYEAYVSRMADLGLPELAYHQAETLTTLESNNGLAWGVIAYSDARRGEMQDAISAINLAGQFAPDNTLVQRTAGEILAWYDVKADKNTISDSAKNGLAKIRSLLEKRTAFAQAYETAKGAYQTQAQATAAQQPAQAVTPSPQEATTTPAPVYSYPSYYYDWGPGWVQPAPWWWWQPVGFFGGFSFFPFSAIVIFDHHDFFRHHHRFFHDDFFFHHDRFFFKNDRFFFKNDRFFFKNDRFFRDRDGRFFRKDHFFDRRDPATWHSDPKGRSSFFGMPARPSASVAQWTRGSFLNSDRSTLAANSRMSGLVAGSPRSMASLSSRMSPALPATGGSATRLSAGSSVASRQMVSRPAMSAPASAPRQMSPALRSFAAPQNPGMVRNAPMPSMAPRGGAGFHGGAIRGGGAGGGFRGGPVGGGGARGGGGSHGGGGGGGGGGHR